MAVSLARDLPPLLVTPPRRDVHSTDTADACPFVCSEQRGTSPSGFGTRTARYLRAREKVLIRDTLLLVPSHPHANRMVSTTRIAFTSRSRGRTPHDVLLTSTLARDTII